MGETKRWTVTYTKHVRQKRKVYQDGMLELDGLSNKIVLYDDSEKLLESRFVKKDEIVESGGTVTFESHLVDVGTHAESSKPLTELDIKRREKKPNLKTPLEQKNTVQKTSLEWIVLYTSQVTQRTKKYHDGFLKLTSSGSQMNQIILLDKERAILSSKFINSVDRLKTGLTYEFPNYLVQICEQRILDGEQLKKNASSEETENPRSSQVGKIFSTARGPRNELLHDGFKKNNFLRAAVVSHSRVNKIIETDKESIKEPSPNEWNALYTTQLSQKAKRYHDGILRTTSCGSHMNQVTLLNEDGVVLSSKYLKLIDCIKTGLTFELPNYLVQICEPRTLDSENFKKYPVEGLSVSKSSESSEVPRSRRFFGSIKKTTSKEIATTNNVEVSTACNTGKINRSEGDDKENFERVSISEEISASSISQVSQTHALVEESGIKCNLLKVVTDCLLDNKVTDREDPGIKPFRDVSQILFNLKKSTTGDEPDPRELSVKLAQFSEHSNSIVFAAHVKCDIGEFATPYVECMEASTKIRQKADYPMHHEAAAAEGGIPEFPENVSPGPEIPKSLDISTSSLDTKISKDVTSEQVTKFIGNDVSNMLSKDNEVEVPGQASMSDNLPGNAPSQRVFTIHAQGDHCALSCKEDEHIHSAPNDPLSGSISTLDHRFEDNAMQLQDKGKCEVSSQLVVGTMGGKLSEESLPWSKPSKLPFVAIKSKGKFFNESTAKKVVKADELPSFDLGF